MERNEGRPPDGFNVGNSSQVQANLASPSISFAEEEFWKASNHYQHCLIVKFARAMPSVIDIKEFVVSFWGLKSSAMIGDLDYKFVLFKLESEEEVHKVLRIEYFSILGIYVRVFRWNPCFDYKSDSSITPIWLELPELPLPLFQFDLLKKIGNSIGYFVGLDKSTVELSRPNCAKICVEFDLLKPRPDSLMISIPGVMQFAQDIHFLHVPKFCSFCMLQGHSNSDCRGLKKTGVFRKIHGFGRGNSGIQNNSFSKFNQQRRAVQFHQDCSSCRLQSHLSAECRVAKMNGGISVFHNNNKGIAGSSYADKVKYNFVNQRRDAFPQHKQIFKPTGRIFSHTQLHARGNRGVIFDESGKTRDGGSDLDGERKGNMEERSTIQGKNFVDRGKEKIVDVTPSPCLRSGPSSYFLEDKSKERNPEQTICNNQILLQKNSGAHISSVSINNRFSALETKEDDFVLRSEEFPTLQAKSNMRAIDAKSEMMVGDEKSNMMSVDATHSHFLRLM